MSDKLKPCPFCGSEVRVFDGDTSPHKNDIMGFVRCTEDSCSLSTMWFPPDEWNTRPKEDAISYALQTFVDYYKQAGIGDVSNPDDDDDNEGFDGDECFNVRLAQNALLAYRSGSAPAADTTCGTCDHYDGACNCKQATDMYYKNLPADFPSCEKWSGK